MAQIFYLNIDFSMMRVMPARDFLAVWRLFSRRLGLYPYDVHVKMIDITGKVLAFWLGSGSFGPQWGQGYSQRSVILNEYGFQSS
jgi:hypothetical protein